MLRRMMLVGLALATLVPAASSAHPAERQTYVAGLEGAQVFCAIVGQGPYGGACFDPVPSDARAVTLTIADASGLKVGGSWAFRAPGSSVSISRGEICGSRRIIVPGGGEKRLLVWLDTATHLAIECANQPPGTVGPATTGTVTAAWSHTI